nr:glycoside hydrolase domain-containing protein [uncultured Duganella sp.]
MTVLTGVKAPFELTQYAIAIKQQGIDFAMRHYTHQAGKSLSLAEARALTDAGIQLGAVWEAPDAHLRYFSRAQGCADGAAAYLMAQSVIAQPSGSAIYFAIPQAVETGEAVIHYFDGINQAFSAAGPSERSYQVGVYGSAACCEAMLARGLATVAWLAEQEGGEYNLKQLHAATLSVDDGQRISVGMVCNSPDRPAGLFRVL